MEKIVWQRSAGTFVVWQTFKHVKKKKSTHSDKAEIFWNNCLCCKTNGKNSLAALLFFPLVLQHKQLFQKISALSL